MEQGTGRKKAEKLIADIRSGVILFETRPNHGNDFQGGLEQLHKKQFQDYLGSCSRFLANKRVKELRYHG